MPWVRLGDWPTPVERLDLPGDVWVKREDLTSPVYGGNKVRTLEAMFGRARAAGATRMWATGAFGSNHVVATVLHAASAQLDAGAILFPQPACEPALANAAALLGAQPEVVALRSVIELPLAMSIVRRRTGAYVMPPGGATPEGALGAMSAAFELAEQAAANELPWPRRVLLAVGSGCSTAGLLGGFHLAHALGLAPPPPRVTSVRVTPWPVTSRLRLARLAHAAVALVDELRGAASAVRFADLYRGLDVDGRWLGPGYGRATPAGARTSELMRRAGAPPLDAIYTAKSAAALLDHIRATTGPTLFWATKSSAPLPRPAPAAITRAPSSMRAWMGRS